MIARTYVTLAGKDAGPSRGAAAKRTITDEGNFQLKEWHRGLRISQIGHTRAATHRRWLAKGLGAAVALLSAAVGTTLFATLSESPSTRTRAIVAAVTFVAALAAVFQSSMKWSEEATAHEAASDSYGPLRRDLEAWRIKAQPGEAPEPDLVDQWKAEWDRLEKTNLSIPDAAFKSARKAVPENKEPEGQEATALSRRWGPNTRDQTPWKRQPRKDRG